jgi:hypothetical protein
MKLPIVVDIESHEDGDCRECEFYGDATCPLLEERVEESGQEGVFTFWERGPSCLQAEQRHKRMVEALRDAKSVIITGSTIKAAKVLERIRAILREEEEG